MGRSINPLVSVVIPFYNDPYLEEAVKSVYAQTYEPLEVIVVDDGSVRETEALRRLERAGGLQVLRQRNRGTASALNAGFRLARGAYLAWLSSDDRFLPDKIEKQVRYMQETGYAISHTAFRRISEDGIAEAYPVLLPEGSMRHFYRRMLLSNVVNGCTVMMAASLFARYGGFNERWTYTHDYELWLRVILSGHPIGYLRSPLTEYRVHPEMGTVLHRGKIEKELDSLRNTYLPKLQKLLAALEGKE
ncbi:glycosyltransferase family 2 protein [Cohnella hongkongensis]|uniref:Glycosyltransferase family 2 protein n=1 Tax=Cohnella hongkongensis TaxID=178337 RepID=A0ABV9F9T0_9BACL